MKVQFGSPAERNQYHQYIREAAREINEDTELLRALFNLENGIDKHSSNGFGYVEKNNPQSATVRFTDYTEEEFEQLLDSLESATASDLGKKDDNQLQVLAENLTDVAVALRENTL
jgi:hypothetical protein